MTFRKAVAAIAAGAGLWAFPTQAGATNLVLTPATVVVDVGAGSTTTFTLRVSNEESAPVPLFAYTWDYWHGGEGRYVAPPGTTPRSAAGWIEVVPRDQVLGGAEALEFLATVSVPPDAVGGYYATLFVQTGVEEPARGAAAVAAGRLGARVFVSVTGTTSQGIEVVEAGLTGSTPTRPAEIAVRVHNTGNTHSSIHFQGVLRTPGGEVIQSLSSGRPGWILPDERYTISVPYAGALEPGAYELAGAVLYGDTGAVPVVLPLVVSGAPAPN